MPGLETNVFPVTNLSALSAEYRLYRLRGLRTDQAEYFQNRQALVRKISYGLRTPATIIDRDDGPHLVVRADAEEPESPQILVRTTVYLDPVPGVINLDFTQRTPQNDEIRTRFLQFMIQAPLLASPRLWQPGSGQPFFEKAPVHSGHGVERFGGFAVRAVVTPDGGMGLCVDLRTKFLSRTALPTHLRREQFRQWKGRHCVYRYGHRWYEIRLEEFGDLTVTEQLVLLDGERISLLDYIVCHSSKPIPAELAAIPHDASVVHYSNNRRDSRAAPAALCFPVFDTQSDEVQRSHQYMTPPPRERRAAIMRFVESYLQQIRFGGTVLRVDRRPLRAEQRMFVMPDLQFGNDRVLSVRGTSGARHVALDTFGKSRAGLLRDRSAGFYITDRLERQYLLLPQSVMDSYGSQFVSDLRQAVDDLFPQAESYDPIVVPYPDRGPKTFLEQGKAILAAARDHCTKKGYALVMVHETRKNRIREEDQLAAMVIRQLRELDICAAVHHSTTPGDCYVFQRERSGDPAYRIRSDRRGRFAGYLRNVALNKVLLTNERWPFVLATPLHADIVIGVDVKANTAGFTIVADHGRIIRTVCSASQQRERLTCDQVRKHLVELITPEAQRMSAHVKRLVIHRDGRSFQSEIEGARKALAHLKKEGVLATDADLTIVEIGKSSLVPLRLFDIVPNGNGHPLIENPQVGHYYELTDIDGYVCATGRAFPRQGTVQPLHVRRIEGSMTLAQCLEDVYALTALAWTRPDDCTRDPVTLKLTDRRLAESAGEFDADALAFEEGEIHTTEDSFR
jgi:hypothetical protein